MNDPYETTETHLSRLLGRALNSFDLPDATVERLDSALAHASSLHSSHHSAQLDRATYRHAYLLSDGSSLVLWELVHNSGPGGAEQHEVYADESEVRLAASRLPAGFPGFGDTSGYADGTPPGPRSRDAAWGHEGAAAPTDGAAGRQRGESHAKADEGTDSGTDPADRGALGSADVGPRPSVVPPAPSAPSEYPASPASHLEADAELLARLIAAPPAPLPRMYVPDNSADHARRVLRRAENADRPGPRTAELLRTAFAHHITQVFGRHCRVGERDAGFTLYEHAFLLLDGAEISLWEVEHTATPDGRHMCEVYESESIAREAMEARGRGRSVPRAGL
ncbi:DUF6227 family protein [Streptomyces sp. NPDC048057]|uniref:DUF6227 family protein n=1 Tax=Streptomyces sp. NPDC048057 TaxID=3155628 RepID=UPI0033E348C9